MTQMHGFSLSHEAPDGGMSIVPLGGDAEESDEFPEFDLTALTGNEIQIEMDLSEEPKCRGTLMNATATENIYVHCEFPDLDWVHVVYNGHLAHDDQGRAWTWNEEGVSLVESRDETE